MMRQVFQATPRKSGPEVVQGPGGVTTSPTLLGTGLEDPAEISENLLLTSISSPPRDAAPVTLPEGKAGMKMNE